jgi:hypothetical protein
MKDWDTLSKRIEAVESDRYNRATFEKARDAVKALGDVLNAGQQDAAMLGALVGILTTHRYLSDKMVTMLLTAMGEFASLPENMVSDARNAFAYKLAGKTREALKDDLFWKGE